MITDNLKEEDCKCNFFFAAGLHYNPQCPHAPKQSESCCDKCSGRIEDENGRGRQYGCLNEFCLCHTEQKVEESVEQSVEEWIKEVSDSIASVDSHMINAVGPGGTVAGQIIRKALPKLLAHREQVARERLRKELLEEVETIMKTVSQSDDIAHALHAVYGRKEELYVLALNRAREIIKGNNQ